MKTTLALTAALVTLFFAASAGAATLRLSPAQVRPGAMVTAVGIGFPRSHVGTITVGGRVVAVVRTNTAGAFARRFRAPALRRGQKAVLASVFGRRVSSILTLGITRSSSVTAFSTGQRVLVSPIVGVSGTRLSVRGARFAPGRVVRVLYDGSLRPPTVVVAPGGTFAKTFRVPATPGGANSLTVRWGRRAMAIPFAARLCGVQVCLPYLADFSLGHGGFKDMNGVGTGFTMVQKPSSSTDADGYIPANLTMTKAGPGTLAITTTGGLAFTSSNSQDNALGVGVNSAAKILDVKTTLLSPPDGTSKNEQAGLWFGSDEDNYVKLIVLSGSTGTKIQLLKETAGSQTGLSQSGVLSLAGQNVALKLETNPVDQTVQASYSIGAGSEIALGALSAPSGFFTATGNFTGIFASHRSATGPLTYTFGDFSVTGRLPAPPPPGPTPGTWSAKASLPVLLEDAGGAELGGKLYVVGGKTPGSGSASTHVRSLYAYNPGTDSWTQKADLPAAYASGLDGVENPAVVGYNGLLYVFGGANAAFSGAVSDAASYDPGTDTWTMLAPMPGFMSGGTLVSDARAGAPAEVIGTKIYVVGGMDGQGRSLNTLLEYDTVAGTWAHKAKMSTKRDNPGSAVLDTNGAAVGGERLFVFGGRTTPSGSPTLNTVEMYDPSANTWTSKASMPTGRRSMVVGTIGGKAQVMGGERTPSGGVFAQNEQYDPVANSWTTLKPMLTPRHGAAAGTISGVVYVAGGGTTGGTSFSDVNEAFSLP